MFGRGCKLFIQPTTYGVIAGYRLELGLFAGANLQPVFNPRSTARRKAAAGRQVNQIRDVARDDIEFVFDFTQHRD
jgi:hypothetical protein